MARAKRYHTRRACRTPAPTLPAPTLTTMSNGQTPPETVADQPMAPITPPPAESVSERLPRPPVLGLAEAARATGLSVSTVRRRKRELVSHGATVSADGWQIPVAALVALGMLDRSTPPPDDSRPTPDTGHDTPADTAAAAAEIARLRQLLDQAERRAAQAEQRAMIAEAIAAERDRIIAAKDQTLRILEPPAPAVPPRRRWWQRG